MFSRIEPKVVPRRSLLTDRENYNPNAGLEGRDVVEGGLVRKD